MSVRQILDAVDDACRALDSLPVSPPKLSDRLLGLELQRQEAIALRDPDYAAYAAKVRTPGGSTIVSNREAGLTAKTWRDHMRRRRELAPPGYLADLAHYGSQLRLGRLSSAVLRLYDRVTRGWDDRDLWSLDHSLARRVSQQLSALAENAYGWPSQDYPTFEQWQEALFTAARQLDAYARSEGIDELTDHWAHLPDGPEADQARAVISAREVELVQGATQAWHWIADNHANLWW